MKVQNWALATLVGGTASSSDDWLRRIACLRLACAISWHQSSNFKRVRGIAQEYSTCQRGSEVFDSASGNMHMCALTHTPELHRDFFVLCIYSNIQEMRARHKDAFLKKHNLKLGFMSAFVKASAFALQEQPVVNAGEFLKTSVAEVFRAVCEYRPAVTFRGSWPRLHVSQLWKHNCLP